MPTSLRPTLLVAASLLLPSIGAACDTAESGDDAAPASVTVASPAGQTKLAARGGELFVQNCAACHGDAGKGTQLGPSLSGAGRSERSGNLDAVTEVIRNGAAPNDTFPVPMPPLGGNALSADDVRALASYVVSLGQ